MTKEANNQGPSKSLGRPIFLALAVTAIAAAALMFIYRDSRTSPTAQPDEPSDEPMEFDTEVQLGHWAFQNRGCAVCHGPDGQGGVENTNYVLGTVPALDAMAERLMLFGPEDAQVAIDMIEQGVDPQSRIDDPPFDGYPRFLAQYDVVLGVINNGATAARADPEGPEPQLQMPAWGEILNDREKRAIIAYLITLYDWDDEGFGMDDEEGDDPYAGDNASDYSYYDDDSDDEDDPYADNV